MSFKDYANDLIKHTLFIMAKIIGFSLFTAGLASLVLEEENIYLCLISILIGFLLIDLTPSFIKKMWKFAGRSYTS